MTEHTPTPWRSEKVGTFGEADIYGPNGEELALIYIGNGADDPDTYPAEANAAFIVKAVNSHDALVKALERINDPLTLPVEGVGTTRMLQIINAMAMIAKDALAVVGEPR